MLLSMSQGFSLHFVLVCSGEVRHANHKLFTEYKDFGRVRSGKDREWAVGEFLSFPHLHLVDFSILVSMGKKKHMAQLGPEPTVQALCQLLSHTVDL